MILGICFKISHGGGDNEVDGGGAQNQTKVDPELVIMKTG